MRSAVILIALTSFSFLALPPANAWAEDASDSTVDAPWSTMDRPITGYIWVEPDPADLDDGPETNHHVSNIIFLNRCEGGCTINPSSGFGNDSRTNTSSIIGRTTQISAWGKGDEQWDQLVDCVKAMYDPYDVIITDVDPGATVEHFEAIVAGTAGEAGMQNGVGGVSPFTCGVINNAITFNFANSPFYANGIAGICETVGQETAHAFGLEHEYLCSDPMTYLPDCGKKYFQDINAACGEYEPTNCQCSGGNQNSHRSILGQFGPGANPGPKMEFVRPLPNSNVDPSFVIEVSAGNYYYGLKKVEVFVNGTSLGPATSAPYIFNAPDGVDGITALEVRATDTRDYESSTAIEINVGSSCAGDSCPEGRVCYKSFCIADATIAGGFGGTCDSDSVCDSNICAKDSDGVGTCTDHCDLNSGDCPTGFGCLKAGTDNVCWPGISEDSGGCGCNTTSPGHGVAGMMLVLLGLLFQRRRRRN